jgi:hypothetical protein
MLRVHFLRACGWRGRLLTGRPAIITSMNDASSQWASEHLMDVQQCPNRALPGQPRGPKGCQTR